MKKKIMESGLGQLCRKSACLKYTEPCVRFLVPHKPDVEVQVCNPSTQEVIAGRSENQGHPGPFVSMVHLILCFSNIVPDTE